MNLIHIESRPSKPDKRKYEFFVHCRAEKKEQITDTIEKLKESAQYLHVLNKTNDDLSDSGDLNFGDLNSNLKKWESNKFLSLKFHGFPVRLKILINLPTAF